MSSSSLRQLLSLINDSVAQLEKICDKNETPIPNLDTPFNPKSEVFRKDPLAAEAASIIAAAAFHLSAIVSPPPVTLYQVASGVCISTTLDRKRFNSLSYSPGKQRRFEFASSRTLWK